MNVSTHNDEYYEVEDYYNSYDAYNDKAKTAQLEAPADQGSDCTLVEGKPHVAGKARTALKNASLCYKRYLTATSVLVVYNLLLNHHAQCS